MTEIKPLFPADTDKIAKIEAECFPRPFSVKQLAGFFENSCTRFSGLYDGASLVGYSVYYAIGSERELIRIAVLPDFRRRGGADMLLGDMLKEADRAFLEVRASNSPAIALYEKHGFLKVGIRKDYYSSPREDAVMMTYTAD